MPPPVTFVIRNPLPSARQVWPGASSSTTTIADDDAYFDYSGERQWDDGDDNTDTDLTTRIAQILANEGVSCCTCADVYEMTVAQAMAMASLGTHQGYLLVLDGHDYYGTSCAKENWIETQRVTCYNSKSSNVTNHTVPCTTSSSSDVAWSNLQRYMWASTHNPATDAWNELGPPASHYQTPFNTILAYWQVDTNAVISGLAHGSSILQDNQQSHVNARIVEWVLDYYSNSGDGAAISLLAVDNVALNGNALLSVARNQCGQQLQQQQSSSEGQRLPCGTELALPRMTDGDWTVQQWMLLVVAIVYSAWLVYSVVTHQRPRLLYTLYAHCRTAVDGPQQQQQLQQHQYYLDRKQDLISDQGGSVA